MRKPSQKKGHGHAGGCSQNANAAPWWKRITCCQEAPQTTAVTPPKELPQGISQVLSSKSSSRPPALLSPAACSPQPAPPGRPRGGQRGGRPPPGRATPRPAAGAFGMAARTAVGTVGAVSPAPPPLTSTFLSYGAGRHFGAKPPLCGAESRAEPFAPPLGGGEKAR